MSRVSNFQAEGRRQLRLLAAAHAVDRAQQEHRERYEEACRVWCGGDEPAAAKAPWWTEGALGRRLAASPYLGIAQEAPSLRMADIPPAAAIVSDSVHWHVAADVLIRAVVFDEMDAGHPSVRSLAGVLAPVAQAELRRSPGVRAWLLRQERHPRRLVPGFPVLRAFPALDAPLVIVSLSVLAAIEAVTGSGPAGEELAVLSQALDGAIPGVAGSVVVGVVAQSANPLEALAAVGAVQPPEVLGAGLAVLSALVRLIKTDAASAAPKVA
jgi:hypothetical protein